MTFKIPSNENHSMFIFSIQQVLDYVSSLWIYVPYKPSTSFTKHVWRHKWKYTQKVCVYINRPYACNLLLKDTKK